MLMDKRVIVFSLIFLTLVGIWFYLSSTPSLSKGEHIDVATTKDEVLQEIEKSEVYAKKTSELVENKDLEIDYLHPEEEHNNDDYNPRKEAIKYFAAGIQSNDPDIFMSSFYVETISKDLFKDEEPDKDKVLEDMIRDISRSGTLEEILYKELKGKYNSSTNKVEITMIFKDKSKVPLELELLGLKDSHSEKKEEHLTYVITTSVWDIIKQIKAAPTN